MLNSSPHMKLDKPYTQSPQYKKQYPYNLDTNIPVRNSFTSKTIKENRQNTDSQYNEELEYYKNRCADLEIYGRQLKSELDAMIIRMSKQGVLDDKTEFILHQNQILNQDLDKLQKSYAQKKTECELWRSKYEQQLNSAVQLKAQYELDLKKLSNELKLFEEKNNLLEKERSQEVEVTKTTIQIQNEQQKHSYLKQIDMLENQVRKLREYADMRDKETDNLEMKFSQILQEREYYESQLLKENDILRNRLQEQEREFLVDMNSLRQKQDILYQGQVENLKKQFITQQEIMDTEIEKLKGLLDIKNTEIETLLLQNKRMRANYEDETQTIRNQYETFEQKTVKNEQKILEDSQNAERTLRIQQERDIQSQKSQFIDQIKILENQVNTQNKQISEQENQLVELQKNKQELLQINSQEQERSQNIINSLKKQILQQQESFQIQMQQNYRDYEQQKQELINFNEQQSALMKQLQQQIQNLNQIIELKEKQYETTLIQFKQLNTQTYNKFVEVSKENEQIKVESQKYIDELEEQIVILKQLNGQQEQKIVFLESSLGSEKLNAEKQIINLDNENRQKWQIIEQLRIELITKEQNILKLQNEIQDTKNALQNQLEEEKQKIEQEMKRLQISQNEELANTKQKWHLKENSVNSELIQLKSQLQTQQTLNIELSRRLELQGQQIKSVVNESDVIKQYKVLSEIQLINRLKN
ncbi:unnamed protein product [Paramecium sonneborni]|uniref:Uncharacterized protein n=1 Tax=Paramecium sonneborni TaxID=65129 RepID=A0A8S1QQU7_9CILI|nr:unnamed protein product [Paramecium sonneborni]